MRAGVRGLQAPALALALAVAAGCATLGPRPEGASHERPPRQPGPEPQIRRAPSRAAHGSLSQSLIASPEPAAEAAPRALTLLDRHRTPLRAAADNRWTPEGWQIAGRLLLQDLGRPYLRDGVEAWRRLWRRSPALAGGLAAGAAALGALAWMRFERDQAGPLAASNTFRLGATTVSISGAMDPETGEWRGTLRLDLGATLLGGGAARREAEP